MGEKELIKKVVGVILYGWERESPTRITLTSEATKELAGALKCELTPSILDSELSYLIFRHPYILSLYGITADDNFLVKYKGKTIFYGRQRTH